MTTGYASMCDLIYPIETYLMTAADGHHVPNAQMRQSNNCFLNYECRVGGGEYVVVGSDGTDQDSFEEIPAEE